MELLLSLLNTSFFMFMAVLHLYWAISDDSGVNDLIPTNESGRRLYKPSRYMLLCFAFVYYILRALNLFHEEIGMMIHTHKLIKLVLILISVFFMLRFIGDFKYLGLFKTYRRGRFARMDRLLYTPLCFLLSLSHLILALL